MQSSGCVPLFPPHLTNAPNWQDALFEDDGGNVAPSSTSSISFPHIPIHSSLPSMSLSQHSQISNSKNSRFELPTTDTTVSWRRDKADTRTSRFFDSSNNNLDARFEHDGSFSGEQPLAIPPTPIWQPAMQSMSIYQQSMPEPPISSSYSKDVKYMPPYPSSSVPLQASSSSVSHVTPSSWASQHHKMPSNQTYQMSSQISPPIPRTMTSSAPQALASSISQTTKTTTTMPSIMAKPSNSNDLSCLARLSAIHRSALPASPNAMQCEVFPLVLETQRNIVCSAPTGAGKSAILQCALLAELTRSTGKSSRFLAVYVSPSRALCQMQAQEFLRRFAQLGVAVRLRTSDGEALACSILHAQDEQELHATDVHIGKEIPNNDTIDATSPGVLLCTTPEKLEAMTRRRDGSLPGQWPPLRLLLVDEVHHLGEMERGATLETVITRLMTATSPNKNINSTGDLNTIPPPRVVAVSATIPNVEEVASWLGNAYSLRFTERPCPLTIKVVGYPHAQGKPDYRFEKDLDFHVPEVLRSYAEGRPALVFVTSRKGAIELVQKLVESGIGLRPPTTTANNNYPNRSMARVADVSDPALKAAMARGVAWHTAGLARQDRAVVEHEFAAGRLGVIVCTSTLAVGVDLPAFCVVVKSTRAYRGPTLGFQTIERATLVQMVGRAGRPGHDTRGVEVIMTEKGTEQQFEDLLNGLAKVDSTLIRNIDLAREALNVEVAVGNLSSRGSVRRWWHATFAGYQQVGEVNAGTLLNDLEALGCISIVPTQKNDLDNGELNDDDDAVEPTVPGRVASTHHLRLRTVTMFTSLFTATTSNTSSSMSNLSNSSNNPPNPQESPEQSGLELDKGVESFLRAVAAAKEFDELDPRRDQKKALNAVLHENARFKWPKSARINAAKDKTQALIEAVLCNVALTDGQLRQESSFVMERAPRICRALLQLAIVHQSASAVCCAALLRHIDAKSWDELSQLDGVGPKTREKLLAANVTNLRELVQSGRHARDAAVQAKTIAHAQEVLGMRRVPFAQVASASGGGELVVGVETDSSSRNASNSNNTGTERWIAVVSVDGFLMGWTEGRSNDMRLVLPKAVMPKRGGRIFVWSMPKRFVGADACLVVDLAMKDGSVVRAIDAGDDPWSVEEVTNALRRVKTSTIPIAARRYASKSKQGKVSLIMPQDSNSILTTVFKAREAGIKVDKVDEGEKHQNGLVQEPCPSKQGFERSENSGALATVANETGMGTLSMEDQAKTLRPAKQLRVMPSQVKLQVTKENMHSLRSKQVPTSSLTAIMSTIMPTPKSTTKSSLSTTNPGTSRLSSMRYVSTPEEQSQDLNQKVSSSSWGMPLHEPRADRHVKIPEMDSEVSMQPPMHQQYAPPLKQVSLTSNSYGVHGSSYVSMVNEPTQPPQQLSFAELFLL